MVRSESLGGSPLSRAARAGQLSQWYRSAPTDAAGWSVYARGVVDSVPTTWFDELRDAIAPTGAAAARLNCSAGGRGLVVTTGQQPGLFGGPLMTLVKAISARALADALQERTGLPVAPVFWAATDDADFDEAAVVSVALDGGPAELRLEQRAPAGTPMARTLIDSEIATHAAVLRGACGSAPHHSFLDAALDAWKDGATVGDAYVALLRHVLEPLEISVLDASHADVTRTGRPLLQRAAAAAGSISTATHRRIAEITAAGYKPQVEEVPGLSLVFMHSAGVKRRLPIEEAASSATARDARLSATVLLRPVLERSILPSAAYVAGPGELAYFAQVSAVADQLGVPAPLVMPRWSATIVEPRIQRIMDRLDISIDDLADPHAADRRIARARLSPDAAQALQLLRSHMRSDIDNLRRANTDIVPVRMLDGLQRALEHRVERAERRILAGVKRIETDAMRQLATARGALFPYGVRQERKLAYVPFLARYGTPLLERMLEAAQSHARGLTAGSGGIEAPRAAAPASA